MDFWPWIAWKILICIMVGWAFMLLWLLNGIVIELIGIRNNLNDIYMSINRRNS